MRFLPAWTLAFILLRTLMVPSALGVTLEVNLKELRERELLSFMRAVLRGAEGAPLKRVDLPTLAELHVHLEESSNYESREYQKEAQDTLREIESLMRQELAKLDLHALRRLALGDGKSDPGNYHLRPALYLRLIEADVAKIRTQPTREFAFPDELPALPNDIRSRLTRGAEDRVLRRLLRPFAQLIEKAQSHPVSVLKDRFQKLVDAFLRGRDENVAGELLRFTWDTGCGSGHSEFGDSRMTVVFLNLLRERRIAEALGVSFLLQDSPQWLREPCRPFDQWRIDFLEWCGVGWEEVLSTAGKTDFVAAAGSEKAAKHTLASVKSEWTESGFDPWMFDRLKPFLIPGDPTYWSDADPRKVISPETQSEILELLNGAVSEGLGFHELVKLMDTLEDLRRKETKETLRRLLKHPSTTFVNRAAAAACDRRAGGIGFALTTRTFPRLPEWRALAWRTIRLSLRGCQRSGFRGRELAVNGRGRLCYHTTGSIPRPFHARGAPKVYSDPNGRHTTERSVSSDADDLGRRTRSSQSLRRSDGRSTDGICAALTANECAVATYSLAASCLNVSRYSTVHAFADHCTDD